MRAFKLVLAALIAVLAVTAGFVVAAVAALTALTIFLLRRLLGRSQRRVTGPQFRGRSKSPKPGDAIEVTVTEVEPTALEDHSQPPAQRSQIRA